jgi:hypothetical protein
MTDEQRKNLEAVAPSEGTPDELSQEDLKSVAGGVTLPSIVPIAPPTIIQVPITNPIKPTGVTDDLV